MSVQKQDHPSIKVAISGTSGNGKSTLLEKLIRREKAKWVFLYDHKGGDLARRFKVKPCFDAESLIQAVARGGYVVFNPSWQYPGKPEKGFEFFCDFVFAMSCELRGKKIFASDELDMLVESRSKPEELCAILDQLRTFQVDCYFICQAMNGIHNQVRKQFTEVFAFRQGDDNGTEWLEGKGFKKELLLSLKNGEWLYKNMITGTASRGGKAFTPKNAERNLSGL